jgi:enamine deaminase RidA (YjgF/YER057c/UK114 family)
LALKAVGGDLKDIVRTRLLVTKLDKESLEEIARAHRECIYDKVGIRPVCTLVGVKGLVHPDMLCEIETDAFIKE